MDISGDTAIMNDSEFSLLVIKPNKVSHLDFNNVNYITNILDLKCFETVDTNNKEIGEIFAKKLNNNNGCNAITNICFEQYEYLYEICFIDIKKEEKTDANYNELASMLDVTDEQIFGNAILIKTHLPVESKDMNIVDVNKNDIRTILHSRVEFKGVFITPDATIEDVVFRDIESTKQKIIDDDKIKKFEIPFLKHNFIMYFSDNPYEEKNNMVTKIAGQDIHGTVLIVSMLTDKVYTDISKKEVLQILEISKLNSDLWKINQNDEAEEMDILDRKIIKNKYRILNNKYKDLCLD